MSALMKTVVDFKIRWAFFPLFYVLLCAAAAVMGVFLDSGWYPWVILVGVAAIVDRNTGTVGGMCRRAAALATLYALLCLLVGVMAVFIEVKWPVGLLLLVTATTLEREADCAKDVLFRWGLFLGLFGLLYQATYTLGVFVDAPWDIQVLLWGNPDRYIPVLDELVILCTDFDTYLVVLVLLCWQIGYYICRGRAGRQAVMAKVFHGLGITAGLWHLAGLFLHKKAIFWWPEYEYTPVFIPLAAAFYAAFYFMGRLYVRMRDEDQRLLARAFWLVLLAVVFTNVIGEDNIKATVQRHRPLHDTYSEWNGAVRVMNDEIVRGSYSYISGHASSFFTMLAVYFWALRSRKLGAALLAWAAFHAFTRIYTAAHFPYCTLMGSLFGFTVATMIWFILVKDRRRIGEDPAETPGA